MYSVACNVKDVVARAQSARTHIRSRASATLASEDHASHAEPGRRLFQFPHFRKRRAQIVLGYRPIQRCLLPDIDLLCASFWAFATYVAIPGRGSQ